MSSSFLANVLTRTFRPSKCFQRVTFVGSPTLQNYNLTIRNMSSSGTSEELVVAHDSKNKKFFIKLGEAEAKLEYSEEKQKNGSLTLDMWHTEVPPQLQGRGIAKVLAKAAFEYVVDNNLKMHLSCSYLQKYLTDNPLEKYKAVTV